MKKKTLPTVYCEYGKSEQSLCQLFEESFRLYVSQILANYDYSYAPNGYLVQGEKYVLGSK